MKNNRYPFFLKSNRISVMQYSYANQNVSEEFYPYVATNGVDGYWTNSRGFFFLFFFKKNLYHTRFSLANSQNKDLT